MDLHAQLILEPCGSSVVKETVFFMPQHDIRQEKDSAEVLSAELSADIPGGHKSGDGYILAEELVFDLIDGAVKVLAPFFHLLDKEGDEAVCRDDGGKRTASRAVGIKVVDILHCVAELVSH